MNKNIFITDIERKTPSFACAEDGVLFLEVWCTENISMFLKNMGKSSVKHQHLLEETSACFFNVYETSCGYEVFCNVSTLKS